MNSEGLLVHHCGFTTPNDPDGLALMKDHLAKCGPLVKGDNAIQVWCPKCDAYQLVKKRGSKACWTCGYTRTVKEDDW